MAPKWRIAFVHVNVAPEPFISLKSFKCWRKGIVLLAVYKPYTQSADGIISILVTLGLLWLRPSDTYRKFYLE